MATNLKIVREEVCSKVTDGCQSSALCNFIFSRTPETNWKIRGDPVLIGNLVDDVILQLSGLNVDVGR